MRPLVRGSIGLLNGKKGVDDVDFQYNPTTVQRNRRATYSHNGAAFADFPNAPNSAVPSIEWNRNEAEEIQLELFFNRQGNERQGAGGSKNVESELKKLDNLMKPDANTGKPRDLILTMGTRSDKVRITDKSVNERLFDQDLNVQQATVALKMVALRSRSL